MNPGGPGGLYSQIGPGWAAFVMIFFLALALWMLLRSMSGHLRNVRYQQQRDEELGLDQAADRSPKADSAR